MSLNQAQTLSLATTLRMVEERCAQMQRLITNDTHPGSLYQITQDIPADIQMALHDHLAALQSDIVRFAADFRLTVAPGSARQTLVALLAASWQDLEDERPGTLGRYGCVDPAVFPSLDAHVSQIIVRVQAMQSLLDTDIERPGGKHM